MNLPAIHGVKQMYKETRGLAARGNDSVQEWILSHPGSECETAERRDPTRVANAAAAHQEWEGLLAQNAALAFRVARGVLRNDADAEDVAQEALLKAHQRFARLRDAARFRGWLVRVVFRLALDRLRSAKRRQAREAQWVFENTRSVTAKAGGAEFQAHLERALDELPEKQRLVLLLSAMEGHSLEEVGGLLGIPLGTVKSRLFFAKKVLMEKLRCFVNPIENL